MKITPWIVVFMLFFTVGATAQLELGIKAGLSSYDLADDFQLWRNSKAEVDTTIADASYGYHFGLYSRIKLFGLYLEPAVLFNSNSVDYNLKVPNSDEVNEIKKEKYNNLDIPLMVGMKVWFFRVQAGPVAHIFLNSSSELTDIKGYNDKLKDARYGYQAGVGLDFNKIRIDVNYEGNFSSFGETFTAFGEELTIDDKAPRIVASVGYRF